MAAFVSEAGIFTQVPLNEQTDEPFRTHESTSEPVGIGAHIESQEVVLLLKKQLERAEHQLDVKDKQIDALLERDRETNILIQGLQSSLAGVVNALPSGRREERNVAHYFPPQQKERKTTIRDA
jgi:hypothetical protein